MNMEPLQRRQVAYKVRISDILNAEYVKEEGWLPNYALIKGKQVSRANIIAAVISVGAEVVVDDGSGSIALRSFGQPAHEFDVGSLVMVMGKVREFNSQKYVVPEIVKKVDDKAATLRRLELERDALTNPACAAEAPKQEQSAEPAEAIVEEVVDAAVEDTSNKRVYELVKSLDSGEGADFGEVISQGGEAAERSVDFLLKRGEIFEIRPGKLKVLE